MNTLSSKAGFTFVLLSTFSFVSPFVACPFAISQQETTQPSANTPAAAPPLAGADESTDEPQNLAIAPTRKSVEIGKKLAWKTIDASATSKKPESRIAALAALGTLGSFPHAEDLLKHGIKDPERPVRVAAIVAVGTTGDRNLVPYVREALDDTAPEVVFAAAVALWNLGDRTGENALLGVLTGERKSSPGLIDQQVLQARHDLQNPSTLALIGAEQGAYALLGPFGIGLDVVKLLHNSAGGNTARILAAKLLAEDQTRNARAEFLVALHDRDPYVRAAVARALGGFRGKEISDALLETFADSKPTVRSMAAASYLRVNSPGKRSPFRRSHAPRPPG